MKYELGQNVIVQHLGTCKIRAVFADPTTIADSGAFANTHLGGDGVHYFVTVVNRSDKHAIVDETSILM